MSLLGKPVRLWGGAKREGLHCTIWTVRIEMKISTAAHPAIGNSVTCFRNAKYEHKLR